MKKSMLWVYLLYVGMHVGVAMLVYMGFVHYGLADSGHILLPYVVLNPLISYLCLHLMVPFQGNPRELLRFVRGNVHVFLAPLMLVYLPMIAAHFTEVGWQLGSVLLVVVLSLIVLVTLLLVGYEVLIIRLLPIRRYEESWKK